MLGQVLHWSDFSTNYQFFQNYRFLTFKKPAFLLASGEEELTPGCQKSRFQIQSVDLSFKNEYSEYVIAKRENKGRRLTKF